MRQSADGYSGGNASAELVQRRHVHRVVGVWTQQRHDLGYHLLWRRARHQDLHHSLCPPTVAAAAGTCWPPVRRVDRRHRQTVTNQRRADEERRCPPEMD